MLTEVENFGKVKLAWYSIFEIRLANIESSWIKFRGEGRGGGGGGGARVIIPFVDNQSECAYWLSVKYSIFIYIK